MGSLRKSLEKAGYLNPLATGLQEFIRKRREEADQDAFNQIMNQAVTNIRKTYSEQPEEDISFMPNAQTRLGDFIPQLGMQLPTQQGGVVDDPTKKGIDILDEPEDLILGDVKGRKYGTLTADEQRMKIQRSIADALMQSSQLKNLKPGMLERGTQLLDIFGKGYTPEKITKEFKQFDPTKDLFEIDSEGNIKMIQEGVQQRKDKTIGSYIGKDGYHYTKLYDPITGTVQEIKSDQPVRPPKGTTIKIDYPEPQKWKDFGSVINMISYKTDKDGNLVETTPQEKKQLYEVAQNMALGNMLPGSVDFMRTRIWNAWNRENMSQADFEAEIEEGLLSGELSAEEAQDLLDYNEFRPFIYDELIESVKATEEGDQQ